MGRQSIASSARGRALLAIVGVLALMWPALVNRQPFFFPDTTAYVRAADAAVRIASGGRLTTVWTRSVAAPFVASASASHPMVAASPVARGSDGSGGQVMAGRSPYFGMLLYLGWVTSHFWLFVLGQALVAWWLIGLALRCFGQTDPVTRIAVTLALALGSTVALYDSLLLADALAGFGLLAFLILTTGRSRLGRWEHGALIALLLVSVTAHLTHIVMVAAMTALLGLVALARRIDWRAARGPILIGALGVTIGLGSVALTSRMVAVAFGRPPALVPLLTARFIADGPGQAFIDGGCDGGRFAACRLRFSGNNSSAYLWSTDPTVGGFLFADPGTRARLSAEDLPFALAVLHAYPVREGLMILRNTGLQLVLFDSGLLNTACLADAACSGGALPETVRARLRQTPSGQGRWPAALITLKDEIVAAGALAMIAALLAQLARRDREAFGQAALWLALLAVAMLANAFLGGALSDPQGRYQARILWLVPLTAAILFVRWRAGPVDDARNPLPVGAERG